ncbi:DMT family transporter [Oricola thermophila]|uniref:DMT family transporter n=1 Tax=Oricola thermophila TaxID=2742145 RepID=A0A6N1VER7_9HYPH|nr:DMT family transporter [Oricola thermophila]QKV18125.1 DMT family transporter [Oricola thermophila]
MSDNQYSPTYLPYLVMLASPLFFSSNLVFGRYVSGEIAPFLLATIRWSCVALILSPFVFRHRATVGPLLRGELKRLALLGFLGMGVCGGGIYLALNFTTATNGTLIYTTSPVLIIVLERVLYGRRSHAREMVGTIAAFAGVAVIVLRGSFETLWSLSFNLGDVLVLLAAFGWAGYSILYRSEPIRRASNLMLFGLVAMFGALVNLPMAVWELSRGHGFPAGLHSWMAISGIIFISSLLAFSTYQYGVRTLGASIAGVFMYLMPPCGVGLSVIFLGEEFHFYHATGIALVMAGVIVATFPSGLFRRRVENKS